MSRGRHVWNLRGMEGRELRHNAHFSCEIEMRRVRHALDRDQISETWVRVDVAANDVEVVDKAAVTKALRNLDPFLAVGTAGETFVGGVANAENKLVAHSFTHGFEHVEREPHAVFKRAAIGTVEFVRQRRDELVHPGGRRT